MENIKEANREKDLVFFRAAVGEGKTHVQKLKCYKIILVLKIQTGNKETWVLIQALIAV